MLLLKALSLSLFSRRALARRAESPSRRGAERSIARLRARRIASRSSVLSRAWPFRPCGLELRALEAASNAPWRQSGEDVHSAAAWVPGHDGDGLTARPGRARAVATPGKIQRRWGRKIGVRSPLAEPAEVAGSFLLIHLVHLQIVWRLNLVRGEREPVVQPARVHPDGPRMST